MAFSPKIDPSTPVGRVQQALLDRGLEYGGGQDWQCPAHDDNRASLGVAKGTNQPVLLFCQAGCKPVEILDALDLSYDAIMTPNVPERWVYTDGAGNGIYDVWRIPTRKTDPETGEVVHGKDYRQHPHGRKKGGTKGLRHVLYDLPLILGNPASPVWFVEGEKCVDALQDVGQIATTTAGGSNAPWVAEYTETLAGREVRVIADNDLPGYKRAMFVAKTYVDAGSKVSVWRSNTDGKGDDVVDHLRAGYGLTELRRLTGKDLHALIQTLEEAKRIEKEGAEVWPSPGDEHAIVRELVDRMFITNGYRTLHFWQDSWFIWEDNHFAEVDSNFMKRVVSDRLAKGAWSTENGLVRFQLSNAKINALVSLLETRVGLPAWTEMGSILSKVNSYSDVRAIDHPRALACANGLLDLDSRELLAPSPANFVTTVLPFAYNPSAPEPTKWLHFLGQTWPDEPTAIAALQEWFGYILSGDNSQAKALFLLGPPRCGKGVILNVLQHLLGRDNYANPDLISLSNNFGLAACVGKLAAIVGDARFGGSVDQQRQIVTGLLKIIGGDAVQIDRKYKDAWNGVLPIRFVIASNTLPTYRESTEALIQRMFILRVPGFGLSDDKQDKHLFDKLRAEAEGILLWALDGHDRFRDAQRFTKVESSGEILDEIREIQNPISAFWKENFRPLLMEESVTRHSVTRAEAYDSYKVWCDEMGVSPANQMVFARHVKETREVMQQVARCSGNLNEAQTVKRGKKVVRIWPGWRLNESRANL